MPAATAPQPTRRSPRDAAQMPAATASSPTRIGSAAVRAASGGSASQNAIAPAMIPRSRRAGVRPADPADARGDRGHVRLRRNREERQHVEPDEEDDEPLDDRRQVGGEVGPEDGRVELAARGAVDERPEQ